MMTSSSTSGAGDAKPLPSSSSPIRTSPAGSPSASAGGSPSRPIETDQVDLSAAARRLAESLVEPPPAESSEASIEAQRAAEVDVPSEGTAVGEADWPELPGAKPDGNDRLELSREGSDLADSLSEAEVDEDSPGARWEAQRQAKLDRIELLVREGKYEIEPFMVDALAVELARGLV